ncbi:amidase [Vibrio cholerae]
MSKDTRIYCAQGPHSLAPTKEGRLSGTRFVFKDLFDVKGYRTGAGNPQWLATHDVASQTSPLITTLLESGAECVGRVQTDELAYSLNGQNIHYGTPVNPKAPDAIPGGSSSGSAVAVASGDCDFSIGTDTGGSVRVPASYCGLYGLRPTHGALSLQHCFELAARFDTAGILTRDLAMMERVWTSLSTDHGTAPHQRSFYLDEQCRALMSADHTEQLMRLKASGVKIQQGDYLARAGWTLDQLSHLFRTLQGFEIIRQHGEWLERYGESLDPAIATRVEWARTLTESQYTAACDEQQRFKQALVEHMEDHALWWLLPTTPAGAPKLTMPANELAVYRSQLMGLTSLAGLSGLPQLHLPNAAAAMPCGLSFLGSAHSERALIQTAMQLNLDTSQGVADEASNRVYRPTS